MLNKEHHVYSQIFCNIIILFNFLKIQRNKGMAPAKMDLALVCFRFNALIKAREQ